MAIDNFTHIEAEPERQDIVITRIFDAPMNLVFEAYVDPTLIPRWWGPKRFTTTVEEMDPRPGGSWKFGVLAKANFDKAGIGGLVPKKRGPRGRHKLNEKVFSFLAQHVAPGGPIRARGVCTDMNPRSPGVK